GLSTFLWVYARGGLGITLRLDQGSAWKALFDGYVLICTFIGLAAIPLLFLYRWLAGKPVVVASNYTRTVDVAKELGYKPVGRGRNRSLAWLPGNHIFQVDYTEKTLLFPNLPPAWEGLSILHLSDLHFSGSLQKAFYQRALDFCADWEPDLV